MANRYRIYLETIRSDVTATELVDWASFMTGNGASFPFPLLDGTGGKFVTISEDDGVVTNVRIEPMEVQ